METEMLRKVREMMSRDMRPAPGTGVVVGLSGGSDSLCLLVLLTELSEELDYKVTAVHVHHGIRGEAADRDEAYCLAFCEERGIAFRSVHIDVPALSAERGTGIEETGRTERYRVFAEIAAEVGATRVAVAHHADDSAETILLHLTRGSSLRGLTGIPADSTPFADRELHLIRPLVTFSKRQILAEMELRGLAYCEDATNYVDDGDRNLLRNRVMPLLTELNAHAGEHIAAAGERLTSVWKLVDSLASEAYGRLVNGNSLDAEGLTELPEALQREVALRYLETVCGHRRDLTDNHIAMVCRLCTSGVSAEATLPYGVTLVRGYREIHKKGEQETFAGRHEIARRELERGVKVTFFGERPRVFAFSVKDADAIREESVNFPADPYTNRFDYDTIGKACVLRTRRPGDRIAVTADGHTQTVQNVFVNRKIPRGERDALPLVLTADEAAVIWIPGVRASEAFRVTDATKRVLEITVTEEENAWKPSV